MKERSHLSYIEAVIILVVLGVFTMRVVPRVAQASPESQICDLIDGLEQMRSQLDVYRARHDGSLPDVGSFDVFQTALTTKAGRYDPYVKKIPVNPFNNLNTVRFDAEPAGANLAGWRLDTETGLFQADDSVAHAGL
jgi:general secretion pathway protein G